MDGMLLSEKRLEVAVGLSRKWDAREAGREVANNTLKQLEKNPNFFLLFSTIHYKNHGGFQEFLNGVWDVLPDKTPLVGGTIAGFCNNNGMYTRGATALAVSYPNMTVATGIGLKSKRQPKKAAKECSIMIDINLKKTTYKNKILINFLSAPIIPKIPTIGRSNIVKSKTLGDVLTHKLIKSFSRLGYGVGEEVDVIESLSEYMPNYHILGGSTVDNGKMMSNYQFINNKICTDSIVGLGCALDVPIYIEGLIGLRETDKTFTITDTAFDNKIITKIDDEPATPYLSKLLGLSEETLKELGPFYYKYVDYLPITFEENRERVIGIGGIFGNNIVLSHKMGGKQARLLTVTGNELIDNVKHVFSKDKTKNLPFIFGFISAIYPFTLGSKMYSIKNIIDDKLGKIPYLLVYPMVENIRIIGKKPSVRVYSINILSLKIGG